MWTAGTLYLIVGASGSGKDTLIQHTTRIIGRVFVPIKYCTRKPRQGEMQGREYRFVSERQFRKLKLFTKYEVYGASYGVGTKLLQELSKGYDVFLNISNRLTGEIKARYPRTKVVYVFVSLDKLKERILMRRREDEKSIAERLERARENLNFIGNADFIVNNNGTVRESVASVASFVISNRMGDEFGRG
jgi:guanylate kinase